MRGVDEGVEPTLGTLSHHSRVAAVEGIDQEYRQLAQTLHVVGNGLPCCNTRGVLEQQHARFEDVSNHSSSFAAIWSGFEIRREQLERAGASEVAHDDAAAMPYRDQLRLFELTHGFAQSIAVGPVICRQLALAQQSFTRLQLPAQDLGAQVFEDGIGQV